MNEALNEAVYERFRFIEWDIILASIHSLFKRSIQPSYAYQSKKIIYITVVHQLINGGHPTAVRTYFAALSNQEDSATEILNTVHK